MKIISWNVNGLRAVLKKNFTEFLKQSNPDVVCLQEIKLQIDQVPPEFDELLTREGYTPYWADAQKKGYSGVATLVKSSKVISVVVGLKEARFDDEGRTLTTEHEGFYLVNCYFPNSQHGLLRLNYKLAYNDRLLGHVKKLNEKKDVIICGDFNVAHEPIDLKNPKANEKNPGFYIDERNWFSALLKNGFTDTFRKRHVDQEGHYSWWSYRFNARDKNIGWRIDYFIVNNAFNKKIKSSLILKNVVGSDHCPLELIIE